MFYVLQKLIGPVLYAYLFDGFEAKGVGLELIGEAGGLSIELVRHVPHTGGELKIMRILHCCAAYIFLARSSWFILSISTLIEPKTMLPLTLLYVSQGKYSKTSNYLVVLILLFFLFLPCPSWTSPWVWTLGIFQGRSRDRRTVPHPTPATATQLPFYSRTEDNWINNSNSQQLLFNSRTEDNSINNSHSQQLSFNSRTEDNSINNSNSNTVPILL